MGCCTSASNRTLPAEPKFRTDEPFLRFREVIDDDEVKTFEKVYGYNVLGLRTAMIDCPPDGEEGNHKGSQEGATLGTFHGTLEITEDGIYKLPKELRLGPWSKPGVYDAVCRFSLADKTYRASLKFDYQWKRGDKYTTAYSEEAGYYGMDINFGATYVEGDNTLSFADAYDVYQLEDFAKGGWWKKLYYLLCKTNSINRVLTAALNHRKRYDAVAASASALDFNYNSKMPSACGPAAVKYSLVTPRKIGPPGEALPKDAVDHVVSRKCLQKQVLEEKVDQWLFDFRIQIATSRCCPGPIRAVEDQTLLWNETSSIPIVLGTLRLHTGASDKSGLFALPPDAPTMKFAPWNCPPDHRPLGNVGRCRRYCYFRHAKERLKMYNLAPAKCPFGQA